ncbi:uncharacterized protein METZ01_LOCUS203189 [marine metagenome]|uniref:Uncharacterized protein n=1 Tax=marine metagenome TaxID=408172 RepID=A0A382EIP7_9ZZZZ
MLSPFTNTLSSCRRSSGVERALGKGEAEGSIPSGGTIIWEQYL